MSTERVVPPGIKSFREFWPYYVLWHQHPLSQWLHVAGLLVAIAVFFWALVNLHWAVFLAPVIGYGPAFAGHFIFEGNRPATFQYPAYSFVGDFLMCYKVLTGQMKAEIQSALARSLR